MGRKSTVVPLVIAVVALMTAACAGPGGTAGPPASATGEIDTGATIAVGQLGGPTSLDPHLLRNPSTDVGYIFPIYDMLMYYDENLEVAPMLAESWEVSDDGMSMDIQLRQDVTFHDGSGFDADVVKANFDRARNLPGSTAASELADVSEVTAEEEYTVRVGFTEPTFDFPITLSTSPGISAMISGQAIAEGRDLAREAAGSGPFELGALGQDRVRYVRNEAYWNPDGMADVAEATLISYLDDTARRSALQSGEIQAAIFAGHLATSYQPLLDTGDFVRTEFDPGVVYGLYVNMDSSPQLKDPRVRRALSMGLDRAAMNEAVLGGSGKPAFQYYPEGTQGHVAELEQGNFDPQAARELLAEAGAENLRFDLIITETEPAVGLATIAQAQLAQIGVTVNLQRINGVDAYASYKSGTGNGYSNAMLGTGDPSRWVRGNLLAEDRAGGQPEAVVEAATAAQLLQLDDPERAAAFENLSRVTDAEPVDLPLIRVPIGYIAATDVVGVDAMAYAPLGVTIDLRALGRTR
jgi:peptide/nickel transport system substrate-binding protein